MKTFSLFFKIATYTAMLGWLILIFLPNWQWTNLLVKNGIAILLSAFYVYILFIHKNISETTYPKGGFGSLKAVMNLFQNPRVILAGWIHYLAFDLMIGLYIKTEANAIGMSHWLQISCFLLTLMFGPAGYLLFMILSLIV